MTSLLDGFRLQPGMTVEQSGQLCFADVNLVELANQFGTPLYVLNEQTIRENCQSYLGVLSTEYPNALVAYASKAFLCQAMCRLLAQEGMGLDVVSGGELYTAQTAGFPAERIILHGVNRSQAELRQALQYGVGRIVIDNLAELQRVNQAAGELGVVAQILIRVTTGVAAHTHHYVQTSLFDSKFGFHLAELASALAAAGQLPTVRVRGLHCHIGSQIMLAEPFVQNLRILLETVASLLAGRELLDEINVGGGLGTYYMADDEPVGIRQLARQMAEATKEVCQELQLPLPRLILEPGRSIVNEAGLTLYTIGGEKVVPGVRKYLFVDGGMTDNIRPALYNSRYEAVLVNRMHEPTSESVSIAGRCCESGDMLAWDQRLPAAQPGDILAVARTGAYNYSMASNYNRLPRPAVILLSAGKAHVIVERESYADVTRLDRIPSHLATVI